MAYSIEFRPSVRKELSSLSREMHRRVLQAILSLAQDPCPPGCKLLRGERRFRIRVGDYRVLYEVRHEVLLILVVRVGHRREVYR